MKNEKSTTINETNSIDNYCTKELGSLGEDITAEYLKSDGYKIIERNFRCRVGEIDIIASKNDTLAFIEVKSRRSLIFGLPQEAVNYKKINYIKRVASYYLTSKMRMKKMYSDYCFRFDVVEVCFVTQNHEINHIKDAF